MNIFEMLRVVKSLEGDYAECGVYRGYSAEIIARGMEGGTLWLFDSFCGHGDPGEFDKREIHPKGRYCDTSVERVLEKLPLGRAYRPVVGYIPDTFSAVNGEKFRFVHIDVDHYEPTKAACEFFKPRMVPGGIIRFDDYTSGDCPGARKAVDEIFESILLEDARWIAS